MYIDVGIANKGKCQCTPVPLTASAYTLSRRICIFSYFIFFYFLALTWLMNLMW